MATLTAKEIREMADEWALLQSEIGEYIAAARPFKAKADAIEAEIKKWLKTNGKPQRIEGELAIAEFAIADKFGDREIDLTEFLSAVAGKPAEEWQACLVVEVKKAEELLGKDKVNEISERPTVTKKTATLTLKK